MRNIIFTITLLFIFSPLSTKGQTQNKWIFYAADGYNSQYFYNKSRIQVKKNGNLLAWTKKIEEDRSYTLIKYEINCFQKSEKILEYVQYNTEGIILTSGDNEGTGWLIPVPDSVGEIQIKTICANRPKRKPTKPKS